MKVALSALFLLLALSAPPFARAQAGDGARQVDEFGDVLVTDWLAHLDNFAIELKQTNTTTGYIVAYTAPNKLPGWPLRRSQWARGYLIRDHRLSESRVQVVHGGYRDEPLYQLWAVEPGAKLPFANFDFSAALARETGAYLFDRAPYFDIDPGDIGIESGYAGYLDEKGHYAPFAEALRQDPAARGYLVAYVAGRQRRGADRRLAARAKLGLLRNHPVGADRVVALGGGRGAHTIVEFWIVPPGAAPPRPTPATSRARRGRR